MSGLTLRRFDCVQIRGVHPRNPVTGDIISDFLQYFAVTDDMTPGTLDLTKLTPRSGNGNSGIPEGVTLVDVVSVNGRKSK